MADAGPTREEATRHLLRGEALLGEGRFAEAADAFGRAVELDSTLPGCQAGLADAYTGLHRWRDAYASYLSAIQAEPGNGELHIRLGDMLRASGDDEKASEAYLRGAELGGWRKTGQAGGPPKPGDAASLYLDLLKRCLTFLLWDAQDGPLLEIRPSRPVESLAHLVQRIARRIRPPARSMRQLGLDWPSMALTMVGELRLDNVQHCVEEALRDEVPGDLIEAGVWRGGVPILMRAILQAHGITNRRVWVADSFEGLPEPDAERYPADRGFDLSVWTSLAVPIEEVKANFERFGLLDDQVRFLQGWFKDTLPQAPIDRLAVLRLDGDLYESTMDGLVHLYPKLSPGGFAIIDDYRSAPPCRQAVDDYRREHGIDEEIQIIDWSGVYWRRG